MVSSVQGQAYEGQLTFRVLAVTEVILFTVGISEDPVASEVYNDDSSSPDWSQLDRLEGQIAGLQGVREWHPSQVANCKHETEAISGDVHGSKYSRLVLKCSYFEHSVKSEGKYLVVQTVRYIPSLERQNQPHRVCNLAQATATRSLLARHADIDEGPKNEPRSQFIE
jgi:hypothetical protein